MSVSKIADMLLDTGLVIYRAGFKLGEDLYDLTHPKSDEDEEREAEEVDDPEPDEEGEFTGDGWSPA